MKLLAPFALIVFALVAVVWLDDTPPEADLVFVNQNEVFTLDPQRMSYIQDLRLAHALYEGLVRWNNFDFSVLPAAAELPRRSEDGRTYTFSLRPGARWSNGEPVTAHDFIYSWRRAILPDTAADYSSMFFVIEGAEAFFRWRQEQTAAFLANPFRGGASATEKTLKSMTGRLRRLLEAEHLPSGIAMPEPDRRAALAAAVERLETAATLDPGPRADALAAASEVRTWLDALDTPSSRSAETHWMWQACERRFRETVGLVAPDDRTLEVTLTRPTAYFVDLLCFGVFFPVHRPTVEGWPDATAIPAAGWASIDPPPTDRCRWIDLDVATGKVQQRHEWAKPGRHLGNGPYRLDEWRYKRDLRLVKNPRYRAAEAVQCSSILALTIEDTNTAVLAFESGHIDWLVDVSVDYEADMLFERQQYVDRHADAIRPELEKGRLIDDVLADLPPPGRGERRNIHVFPTFGTDFYSFNCRPELSNGRSNPFADPAVRRAFVLSVDKRTIVERVTRLNEPVVTTLIPPGSIPGYESPAGLPYDPDRARRELREAGWVDDDGDGLIEHEATGDRFPVIDLLYTTNVPRYKWISLDLKSQWEQELGVRVELRGTETKFYKEDLKQGKFMIARGRWYGDYGDPTTFLDLCRSTDGNNDRKYASDVVDRLLDEAALERDPAKRMALLTECERIVCAEDVPMLVICQLVQVYMYEPGRVTGLSDHPRLTQFLWQMRVAQE